MYFSKAKVRPSLEGEFTISVLNVNSGDVKLANRPVIGRVVPHNEILQVVTKGGFLNEDHITYGSNLDIKQKNVLKCLLDSYSDIFAANPKKRNRLHRQRTK